MFDDLKKGIQALNDKELERISLAETLDINEAICDVISPEFLTETADMTDITAAGTPFNDKINSLVQDLQFHNQDYLGMSEEDAQNFNPDQHLSGGSAVSAPLTEALLTGTKLSEDNMDGPMDADMYDDAACDYVPVAAKTASTNNDYAAEQIDTLAGMNIDDLLADISEDDIADDTSSDDSGADNEDD
jgi:hypothetical protein